MRGEACNGLTVTARRATTALETAGESAIAAVWVTVAEQAIIAVVWAIGAALAAAVA
jgi:hypothetical protein